MQEELDLSIEMAREAMDNSMDRLGKELSKIRTGKANPSILSSVSVDYYGNPSQLSKIANIKATDGRTLLITPWEKGMLGPIEQAIFAANLGLTPQNDGTNIFISIPPLTEERRKDMVKRAAELIEQAKVGIRSARKDAMDEIKNAVKDGYSEDLGKRMESKVQDLTNEYSNKADKLFEAKEKDIMTV